MGEVWRGIACGRAAFDKWRITCHTYMHTCNTHVFMHMCTFAFDARPTPKFCSRNPEAAETCFIRNNLYLYLRPERAYTPAGR